MLHGKLEVYRGKSKLVQPQRTQPWLSLLTIIMSSERPSETNRIRKFAGSVKGKLSSFLHSSRTPTAPSIEMSSSSNNASLARWVIWILFSNILLKQFRTFKIFATQCHLCRSRTYHSICHGNIQIVWAPNFSGRAQATWFCYSPRIRNPIHGQWLCCAHDCCH